MSRIAHRTVFLAALLALGVAGMVPAVAQELTSNQTLLKCLQEADEDPSCRKTTQLWYDLICGSRFETRSIECVLQNA